MSMDLTIVSTERSIYKGKVDAVFATGSEGAFEIRPGHSHFLTRIETGHIYYDEVGNTKRQGLFVEGGLLEASPKGVIAVLDTAILSSEIDMEKELAVISKAQEILKQSGHIDYSAALSDIKASTSKLAILRELLKSRKQ
ncbi:MAG: ATP synthase F1 subunit epsilon [Legionellales bacterium]|jgi:F-type H+-transporting ATPase subunit epsilon|nr:ATP synthase F1 subunit epsilon [Legionellales bacterium]OUX64633.1 MAG: ATP synthase F1 subunit epsilon [Gammaproteobacteria bacterium TMED281]